MPRRALAFLSGTARSGTAGKPRIVKGTGSPFWQTPTKTTARRKQAASDRLFFGFFLLARQKKLAFGCENPIRTIVVIAAQYLFDGE